jgi:hypothetical protein
VPSAYRPDGDRTNPILNRAFAAGAGLCVGVLALTTIFITKIENSYATTTGTGGSTGSGVNPGGGNLLPGQSGSGGGQQLQPAPSNQTPQARSHGS